jgi:hypothetical protein
MKSLNEVNSLFTFELYVEIDVLVVIDVGSNLVFISSSLSIVVIVAHYVGWSNKFQLSGNHSPSKTAT